jgi:hypothetical protein
MKNNFTWHEISEKEKEQIKKDSKKLLHEFSTKLSKIKTSESHFKKESGTRDEGEPWKTDQEFREHMFNNSPNSDKDFLYTEKGGWK